MGRRSSERVAEALRDAPPVLDEVARARMERRLLDAARGRAEEGRAEEGRAEAARSGRGWSAAALVAGVTLAAAILTLVWLGERPEPAETAAGAPAAATFHTFEDGETIGRGGLAEDETVRTEARQRVEVRLAGSRIDVTPSSAVRFERIGPRDTRVRLERGAVEVEFHPERRGEQALSVMTSAARVEVIGTVFRVEVDAERATTVRVDEGVVRVVPADGSDVRTVSAGEATRVGLRGRTQGEPAESSDRVARTSRPGGPRGDSSAQPPLDTEVAPAGEAEAAPAEEDGVATAGEGEVATVAAGDERRAHGTAERAQAEALGPELSVDVRFDLAERYHERHQFARARHVLYGIANGPLRRSHRARAWNDIAVTYQREGDYLQAAEAYRRAARIGTLDGRNALYALAVLRERRLGDAEGARAAYRQYLEQAARSREPATRRSSPHVDLSRRALCRLGDRAYCGVP